jgi:hypothetical protein
MEKPRETQSGLCEYVSQSEDSVKAFVPVPGAVLPVEFSLQELRNYGVQEGQFFELHTQDDGISIKPYLLNASKTNPIICEYNSSIRENQEISRSYISLPQDVLLSMESLLNVLEWDNPVLKGVHRIRTADPVENLWMEGYFPSSVLQRKGISQEGQYFLWTPANYPFKLIQGVGTREVHSEDGTIYTYIPRAVHGMDIKGGEISLAPTEVEVISPLRQHRNIQDELRRRHEEWLNDRQHRQSRLAGSNEDGL